MRIKVRTIVVRNDFERIARRLPEVAGDIVRETLQDILDHIRAEMESAKSGRWYLRSYGWHQASAPGEPPAVDYGKLIASLNVQMETRVRGVVQTDVFYAPTLEFGDSKIAPRPFMAPALEFHADRFIRRMARLAEQL